MADNENETKKPQKKAETDSKETNVAASSKKASPQKAAVKKAGTRKAAPKKAPAKKASPKKATVKKAAVKKAASTTASEKKAAPKKAATTAKTDKTESTAADAKTLAALTQIINEIREDNQARDRHVSTLIQEISKGFDGFTTHSLRTDSEREQEMARLYQALDDAFSKAEDSDKAQENRTMSVVNALSESIMRDHEHTLREVQEQKTLQDKQIEHLTKLAEQRSGRNRWIAVPAVIIAILGIVYMFYVVSVMESAMTSMSSDMQSMRISVKNMSNKMDIMSLDTSSMNTNMQHLNRSMGQMSKDLNVLTYHVAPTMKGFSDMMPWK